MDKETSPYIKALKYLWEEILQFLILSAILIWLFGLFNLKSYIDSLSSVPDALSEKYTGLGSIVMLCGLLALMAVIACKIRILNLCSLTHFFNRSIFMTGIVSVLFSLLVYIVSWYSYAFCLAFVLVILGMPLVVLTHLPTHVLLPLHIVAVLGIIHAYIPFHLYELVSFSIPVTYFLIRYIVLKYNIEKLNRPIEVSCDPKANDASSALQGKNLSVLSEKPLSDPKDDLLDIANYAGKLAGMIAEWKLKGFGILGPYGCGKSTMVNFILAKYKENKAPEMIVVRVDGWGLNKETVTRYIINKIVDELSQHAETLRISQTAEDYQNAIANKDQSGWLQLINSFFKHNQSMESNIEEIDRFAESIGKRILIILEDLDRNTDNNVLYSEIPGFLHQIKQKKHLNFILTIKDDIESVIRVCDYHYLFSVLPNSDKTQLFRDYIQSLESQEIKSTFRNKMEDAPVLVSIKNLFNTVREIKSFFRQLNGKKNIDREIYLWDLIIIEALKESTHKEGYEFFIKRQDLLTSILNKQTSKAKEEKIKKEIAQEFDKLYPDFTSLIKNDFITLLTYLCSVQIAPNWKIIKQRLLTLDPVNYLKLSQTEILPVPKDSEVLAKINRYNANDNEPLDTFVSKIYQGDWKYHKNINARMAYWFYCFKKERKCDYINKLIAFYTENPLELDASHLNQLFKYIATSNELHWWIPELLKTGLFTAKFLVLLDQKVFQSPPIDYTQKCDDVITKQGHLPVLPLNIEAAIKQVIQNNILGIIKKSKDGNDTLWHPLFHYLLKHEEKDAVLLGEKLLESFADKEYKSEVISALIAITYSEKEQNFAIIPIPYSIENKGNFAALVLCGRKPELLQKYFAIFNNDNSVYVKTTDIEKFNNLIKHKESLYNENKKHSPDTEFIKWIIDKWNGDPRLYDTALLE